MSVSTWSLLSEMFITVALLPAVATLSVVRREGGSDRLHFLAEIRDRAEVDATTGWGFLDNCMLGGVLESELVVKRNGRNIVIWMIKCLTGLCLIRSESG
jgi:hypothetical protein